MEALTRLVTESLARQVSTVRWTTAAFTGRAGSAANPTTASCSSPASPAFSPCRRIMDFGRKWHVATAASPVLAQSRLSEAKRRLGVLSPTISGSRKPDAGSLPPAACSPSPSSSKTTTWPSSSTACFRARIPCAPASPAATSSASSSSKTRPSAAAFAPPSINGWSPPPKKPPASALTSPRPWNYPGHRIHSATQRPPSNPYLTVTTDGHEAADAFVRPEQMLGLQVVPNRAATSMLMW